MRWRGVVRPSAARFALERSLPGSSDWAILARRSASFSAVVMLTVAVLSECTIILVHLHLSQ